MQTVSTRKPRDMKLATHPPPYVMMPLPPDIGEIPEHVFSSKITSFAWSAQKHAPPFQIVLLRISVNRDECIGEVGP
jgi:hypothetical protein